MMNNSIQKSLLSTDDVQLPSVISESSWTNQVDSPATATTITTMMTTTTVTRTSTTTTTTTSPSSSASSTSCSDYHFDGPHHLHLLFRYPHKCLSKFQKNKSKFQLSQESGIKYHQTQSRNHDLRIKLERELRQKVRQAVQTPPRERMIRRRLIEFEHAIHKRLENDEEKKKLVIQMNDLLSLKVTSSTESTTNSLNEINSMDLRLHPESYHQNLDWSKKSNTKMNNDQKTILWNKRSGLLLEKKEKKCLKFTLTTKDDHETSSNEYQASVDSNEIDMMNENTFERSKSPLYLNNNFNSACFQKHHLSTEQKARTNNNNNHNLFDNDQCMHSTIPNTNTAYSQFMLNKFQNFKNTIVNMKRPLINSIVNTTIAANNLEYNEYDQLLNDSFTFNWNIEHNSYDNQTTEHDYEDDDVDDNDDDNNNDDDMDKRITSQLSKYYQMTQSYLTDEDVQLIHRYYKLYQTKLKLTKMNRKTRNDHLLFTRQSIMEKFGRLTDGEKQLFYFSATRAAYLMASTQSHHKLPDGTHFRLISSKNAQPLDYVTINNSFIDNNLCDPTKEVTNQSEISMPTNIPINFNHITEQTKKCSPYTLPTFIDWNAVVRDRHGPFWPQNYGPICQTQCNLHRGANNQNDRDSNINKPIIPNYTEEINQLKNKQPQFKGIRVVFDSECSPCLSETLSSSSSTTSCSVDIQQLVKDLANTQQWTPPCLMFESRFESGNLRQVRRIGPFHYELLLKPDLYTKRHVQWYFFRVQNILPGFTYTFVIVNFTKPTSLYSEGLQPLLYSKIDFQQNGKKWIRVGRNIKYTRNTTNLSNHLLDINGEYYQLEWEMEFPYANDICHLAYSYPYTYTNLKSDLNELLIKVKQNDVLNKTMNCEVLCQTRAGNSCFLVTITDQDIPNKDKFAVVITARVHPGETNSSWITLGLLQFLTSNQTIPVALKKQYVFYIIPMLNPDGVIVGNYRCSLSGRDLNRNYRQPKKEIFPTVWTVKQFVKWCKQIYKDVIYFDMHGHSRRNNIFMYGCDPLYRQSKLFNNNNNNNNNTKQTLHERILPYIVSQQAKMYFSFPFCRFNVHPSKEATSRVVFWREFELINSFTLEATFNGSTLQNNNYLMKFEVDDFLKMGEMLGYSLYKFHEVLSNPLVLRQTLTNLAKQTFTNLLMTKIPWTPSNKIVEEDKDNQSIFSKITRAFLSTDLRLKDFIKQHLHSANETLFTSTNDSSTASENASISLNGVDCTASADDDDENDDEDEDDDQNDVDRMDSSLEQLSNAIHLLENSTEFPGIQLNEDELNSTKDEDLNCTSDSNSDSEPEMSITIQNSLNQHHSLRGDDIIFTNEEQNILLLDQTKQLKLSDDNPNDNLNKSHKLKRRKKNKKKKLQALRHHHHHRIFPMQKYSSKNLASIDNQTTYNSIQNSKLLSSSSSSSSPPACLAVVDEQRDCDNKLFKCEMMKQKSQNDKELLNRRFYYLNKYAGQSNHGIPCFVEERLFHRSCQRIRTVWENTDLTKSQTIHAQRKFVERFIKNLEMKIVKLKTTDNLLLNSGDMLTYLKQILSEAKHQLQLIQSQLIPIADKIQPYKSSMMIQHEVTTTINTNDNNTIQPPCPPSSLPIFTSTSRQIKTQSAVITTAWKDTNVKRNLSKTEGNEINIDNNNNNNNLNPRSRSCSLFVRHNRNNNYHYNNNNNNNNNNNSNNDNSNNNNNNKFLQLPKIVETISEKSFIDHSNMPNGIET
ncbi:unnamed protein product [Schistosoma turkestanicum]|nr:unnamed protein product [Schistosoma turkestanicum]